MDGPKLMKVLMNGQVIGEHVDQGSHEANFLASQAVLAQAGFDPDGKSAQLTILGQARNFRQTVRVIHTRPNQLVT